MKHTKQVLFTLAALATPGLALAQPADGEAEAEVETTTETTNPDGSTTTTSTELEVNTETSTTPAGGAYPAVIIDRPATLTKGVLRAQAALGISKTATVDTTSGEVDSSVGIGLGLRADYGISDKLEAGLSYGLSLKEFEAKGPLRLHGRFNLKSDAQMRVGPEASIGYGIDSEAVLIGVGMYFQYNLGPQMALYTPGNQLQFAIADAATIGILSLPVGFGYQVDPTIFGFVETNILSAGFIDAEGSSFIFADYIPLTVGAYYTTGNIIDIGASIGSPDVPDIADNFQFSINLRYHKLP